MMVKLTTTLSLFSVVYPLLTTFFSPFSGLGVDEFLVFSSKESIFVVCVVHVTLEL